MNKHKSISVAVAGVLAVMVVVAGLFSTAAAAAPTTPDSHTNIIQRNTNLGRDFVVKLQNERDDAKRRQIADDIVSPDYIQHNAVVPPGRDGLLAFDHYLHSVVPDVKFTLRDVFATQTRVVTRFTITGTLTGGPLLGVPATAQKLEFDGIDIWTVCNGRLFEHWDQFDWPRALIQLGIKGLPAPFVQAAGQPVNR